jgi:ribose-phosphate pyrophosphokinase
VSIERQFGPAPMQHELSGSEPQPTLSSLARGVQRRLLLFGGRSHPDLVTKIAAQLELEPGRVVVKTFSNGETYCRYEESIRGADVFIVQTGCEPVDRNLMELFLMIQAAKLASAKRVTAVMPWFPYAKQDRKAKPREPISSRLVADMLELAGADRVLSVDLHAGQIQGFFRIPVDHMTCLPLFAEHFRSIGLAGPDVVAVAPDAGRAKYAERFAGMLGTGFGVIHKTHPSHDVSVVNAMVGDVEGKIAILYDDFAVTGWTNAGGAQALLQAGAREVWLAISHALFSEGGLQRIEDAGVSGIVVTDTVPLSPDVKSEKVTVLSTAPILATTILNVFSDESVSAVFGDDNQLF